MPPVAVVVRGGGIAGGPIAPSEPEGFNDGSRELRSWRDECVGLARRRGLRERRRGLRDRRRGLRLL
jgi:hypothetical protein